MQIRPGTADSSPSCFLIHSRSARPPSPRQPSPGLGPSAAASTPGLTSSPASSLLPPVSVTRVCGASQTGRRREESQRCGPWPSSPGERLLTKKSAEGPRRGRGTSTGRALPGLDLAVPQRRPGDTPRCALMEVNVLFLPLKEGGPSANSAGTSAICRQPGEPGKPPDSRTWFLSLSVFIEPHSSLCFIPEESFSEHLRNASSCQAAVSPQLVVTAREVAFLIYYVVGNLQGARGCQWELC